MDRRDWTFKATAGGIPVKVTGELLGALNRLDGRSVELTLRERKPKRSDQQNRYYWGVEVKLITDAMREAGNDVDAQDVHEYLKLHVGKLSRVMVTPSGEVLRAPGSTTKLTKQEFSAYTEKVRAWAAETLDLPIPLPNEDLLEP